MKKNGQENKYEVYRHRQSELTLDDYLALDRTTLSIERTHLSYMRTVISMIVAAITLWKILGGIEGYVCAGILLISSLYFGIRGRHICSRMRKNIAFGEDETEENGI